jgi:uncharacterized protein (DUF427 family)
MPKAIWNGQVIAESNDTVMVEGNHYFPRDSIKKEFFSDSPTHTICPWKGQASYFNVNVEGDDNGNAAWYYPEPSEAAKVIKDRVAFWRGVEVVPD